MLPPPRHRSKRLAIKLIVGTHQRFFRKRLAFAPRSVVSETMRLVILEPPILGSTPTAAWLALADGFHTAPAVFTRPFKDRLKGKSRCKGSIPAVSFCQIALVWTNRSKQSGISVNFHFLVLFLR